MKRQKEEFDAIKVNNFTETAKAQSEEYYDPQRKTDLELKPKRPISMFTSGDREETKL